MQSLFHKIRMLFVSLFLIFTLSSCGLVEYLGGMMCELAPDTDHCAQFIAIQSSSPEACERIKGEKFKDTGSNPPRDKCYMQIAINTGDESICKNIKGGPMSYTQGECEGETRTKVFKKLDGELKDIDDRIEHSIEFKETQELIKKKRELEAAFRESFAKLPENERSAYYTKKKDEILAGVSDEELKQQIAHTYNEQRKSFGGDTLKELDGLAKITQTETTAKRLDEAANTLVDTVKGTLVDMIQDSANEKKDAILDAAQEKALEEVYKRTGQDMKYTLQKLEKLKESYDSASEYYDDVNEKYEKLKAAYEKMKAIEEKIQAVEKLGKDGKLDAGKVEVLKGGILLGEGLEYATGYVPVFGSTISTVTKETFGVVNKFATKRAVRTTAIDKCISDPANCDTDNISAY